ncbi:hypothetical protein HYALB_00008425 [Hymenoscyphus albidus]|uniref:Inositol-pentakisphosphate 2-kinase n=1 Tax=Hymenoscyphus albidus TaxID=595503 RepID=A0A9N9LP75_9HELO|nr:hypothetical protein HYALB_00008425 [Hymenoscyphus albidus]
MVPPIPTLPSKAALVYLGEGAANVVYRISVPYPTPPPSQVEEYGEGTPPPTDIEIEDPDEPIASASDVKIFDNKLLRLRKNLATTLPCAVSQANWLRLIVPMFGSEQLVDQFLVQLRPARAIERLNKQLVESEKPRSTSKNSIYTHEARPPKRHGIYLANDEHGLLVTDMTPGPLREEVMEFKPKWLVQSPSAPTNAKRCRQCAKRARANAKAIRSGHDVSRKTFCPLDFVSQKTTDIDRITSQLEPDARKAPRFKHWLQSNTLLKRLKHAQIQLDPKGCFKADPEDEKFRLAMTLRDCTVFLKYPSNGRGDGKVEARIGDLDLKSSGKAEYWRTTERDLINEGWYQATEKESDRQPLTCSLSRK